MNFFDIAFPERRSGAIAFAACSVGGLGLAG